MIERQVLNSKSDNGEQPSLESRIAAAVRADASLSAADFGALIGEAEVAAAAAATTSAEERERALDLSIDPATAQQLILIAELRRDRLNAVLPRLQQKLGQAQNWEYGQRWEADYRQVEALRDKAAQRFARYPALVHELIEIILEAQAVDAAVSRVNGSALPGEHRRLQSVELKGRGLKNFSISNPSVVDMVRLPDWKHSERMLWPPHRPIDPAMVVPMQVGDPRLTTDRWYEVGDEQRAIEQERRRRELEQAEFARKQFYGQA
jgi:hypothetical protein